MTDNLSKSLQGSLKKSRSSIFWIILLLIILIVFNLACFVIFQYLNPNLNIWQQTWSYLDSSVFKLITASLMVPILLLLFDHIFQIRKSAEDRFQKSSDDRKEKQIEAMKIMTDKWDELISIANELINLEIKDDNKADIRKIMPKLDEVILYEVQQNIKLRFPNRDHTPLFPPFYAFFQAIYTTASLISSRRDIHNECKKLNNEDLRSLQSTLSVIKDGLTANVRIPIEDILFIEILMDSEDYSNFYFTPELIPEDSLTFSDDELLIKKLETTNRERLNMEFCD